VIQLIGVESKYDTADYSGCVIFREVSYQKEHTIGTKQIREKKERTVSQDRIFSQKGDGERDDSLREQMFRITQSVSEWIEYVGIEKVQWIFEKMVLDPRDDPGIEERISQIMDRIRRV